MKKTLLFLMVFITVACGKVPTNAQNNSGWIDKTRSMVALSSSGAGFFSEYNPSVQADPYSTYYALMTLKTLNEPVDTIQIQSWLEKTLRKTLVTADSNFTVVSDIYYLVDSLVLLDVQPKNQEKIKNTIESLYLEPGYFAGSVAEYSTLPNISMLIPTYQAINTLSQFGYIPSNYKSIIQNLSLLWQKEIDSDRPDISRLSLIYKTLLLLDTDMNPYNPQLALDHAFQDLSAPLIDSYSRVTMAQQAQISISADVAILQLLIQNQNMDGGFGLFPASPSDMIGIYYTVTVLDYSNQLSQIDIEAIKHIIMLRLTPEGGFANIVDQDPDYVVTYYVYLYQDIFSVDRDSAKDVHIDHFNSRRDQYYFMKTQMLLGKPIDDQHIADPVDDLSDIYYFLQQNMITNTRLSEKNTEFIDTYMNNHYPLIHLFDNSENTNFSQTIMVIAVYSFMDATRLDNGLLQRIETEIMARLHDNLLNLDDLQRVLLVMERQKYVLTAQPQLIQWIIGCLYSRGGATGQPLYDQESIPSLYLAGLALESLQFLGNAITPATLKELLQP